MWQFIVSGYIPGTDLQINFDIIATFSAVTIAIFFVWLVGSRTNARRHKLETLELDNMLLREKLQEISL